MQNYQNLPQELVVEILSRLPVKALVRYKCVCTQWRTLISSPFFASLHLSSSISNPTRHTILSLIHFGYPPVPIDPVSFAPVEKSDLGLDDSYCFGIIKIYVGSINGLICVTGLYEGSIAIWNPSTRVFRQVPPGRIKIYETSIGFGWDPIANDYKVVKLCSNHSSTSGGKLESWVWVWSANLGTWREIKADRNFFIQRHICDVIVNGFTHWIVKDGLGNDSKPLIASFDMTNEVLRLVPVPEHLPWLVPLPPLVPERQLLLGQHYPLFGMNWKGTFALVGCVSRDPMKIYQVWTMENDTARRESWSKKFTFELDIEFHCFVSSINGIFILKTITGELILYYVETRETKILETQDDKLWALGAHYYVESLITMKGFSPLREKTKNVILKAFDSVKCYFMSIIGL